MLVFYATGIASGFRLQLYAVQWQIVLLALILLVTVLSGRTSRLVSFAIAAFWFIAGIYAIFPVSQADRNIEAINNGEKVVLEGVIYGRPAATPEGERFELKVDRRIYENGSISTLNTKTLVTVAEGRTNFARGDQIRISGSVWTPRLLGLPGEFDYPSYLALRGIYSTLRVKDSSKALLVRAGEGSNILRMFDVFASRYDLAVRETIKDSSIAPVLIAMVTGSQLEIPENLRALYARAGVLHILSISGFHVAIVTSAFVQSLFFMLIRWEWLALRINLRKAAMLSALPVMILYLIFTGAAPATARAVVMLAAIVLALASERETNLLDALFMAALLLLLINPPVLFDLGFQLSFLSIWGIIILTPVLLSPVQSRLGSTGRKIATLLAASAAASIATAIPSLAEFHQASLTGILANIIIVPLLGYGALLLGTLALPFLTLIPSLALCLITAAGWIIELSNLIITFLAGIPVLKTWQIDKFDVLVTVAVLLAISILKSRRCLTLFTLLLMAATVLYHSLTSLKQYDGLQMMFLSVGQGDSFLVRFPDRSNMLVDGGGYLHDNGRDFGERYLVPALYSLGVEKIDRLVLTHPHPDHLGGLPAVAEQFRIGEFIQGKWQSEAKEYKRLQAALLKNNVPVRIISGGDGAEVLFDAGAVSVSSITPFNPGLSADNELSGENDDSLILRLKFRAFSAVFMGDAGFRVEDSLLKNGLEPATVLKAGHHGSRYSGSDIFLQRLRPQIVIISAGYGNRFGLPASESISRFSKNRGIIYRTDMDGTITVNSNGNGWQVIKTIESR